MTKFEVFVLMGGASIGAAAGYLLGMFFEMTVGGAAVSLVLYQLGNPAFGYTME